MTSAKNKMDGGPEDLGASPQVPAPLSKRRSTPPAAEIVERMREREADLTGTLFDFDAKIFGRGATEIERLRNLHHEMKEALEALLNADLYADGEGLVRIANADTEDGVRAVALARAVLAKLQGA